MKGKNIAIIFLILLLNLAGYLFLYSDLTHGIVLYVIVIISNSLLYLLLSSIIVKTELSATYLYYLIAAGILFRVLLILFLPTASDDINRYIWDGKVQSDGISPYKYAPSAPELKHLSNDILPSRVNFPDMKTIYPPFAQAVFYLSYQLFGESFIGIKLFLLISELFSMLLLFYILKTLSRDPKYLLLYALCPLPVMMFMVDGHVDGIGFPLLLLFILLYIKNKKLSSYILYGLSISAKIITIIILPLLVWAQMRKTDNGLSKKVLMMAQALVIPGAVFLMTYIPYISGGVNPFESLATFTSHWMFNGSIFNILYNFTGNNQTARLISYALLVFPAAYVMFSRMQMVNKIYYIFFLFFLFAPTVHPWYLTWLVVLLPLCFRWSGLIFVSLISISTYVVIKYQLKGIWEESALILLFEYIPVYAVLFYEIYSSLKTHEHPQRVTV